MIKMIREFVYHKKLDGFIATLLISWSCLSVVYFVLGLTVASGFLISAALVFGFMIILLGVGIYFAKDEKTDE